MSTGKVTTVNNLPLFASDAEIGAAMLGPKRACEWHGIASVLEKHGLPKIDPLMGGRYVPAVKAFFDKEHGLTTLAPTAPDGHEDPTPWQTTSRRPA